MGRQLSCHRNLTGRFPSGWCLFIDSGTNALLLSSVLNKDEIFFLHFGPKLNFCSERNVSFQLGHTFKAIFKSTG